MLGDVAGVPQSASPPAVFRDHPCTTLRSTKAPLNVPVQDEPMTPVTGTRIIAKDERLLVVEETPKVCCQLFLSGLLTFTHLADEFKEAHKVPHLRFAPVSAALIAVGELRNPQTDHTPEMPRGIHRKHVEVTNGPGFAVGDGISETLAAPADPGIVLIRYFDHAR
jgi:hypothetical protein